MKRTPLLSLIGLVLLAIVGCSKDGPPVKLAPVSGRVTAPAGEALPGLITLQPDVNGGNKGTPATGIIARDGTFSVETYPHGKGALPGTYKVILPSGQKKSKRFAKYANASSTPWTVEVPEEGNTSIELKIDPE